MKKILVFLLVTVFYVIRIQGQTYIIPDLERDDFKNLKSWWSVNIWGYAHTYDVPNGYFIAHLNNPNNGDPGGPLPESSEGMENIGFSTAYMNMIYGKDDTIDARIRVRTLNVLPPGSRGWGLWHSEPLPIDINQETWYIEQKADDAYDWAPTENWWRGRISRGLQNEVMADLTFSTQDWHYYRIYRVGRSYYELYVDDNPNPVVHATPADLGGILNEDYGFNCWNDNLVYHFTQSQSTGNDTVEVYYNGWLGTSTFIVDFVEIRSKDYKVGHSLPANGVLRLREVINEIDNGVSDGLWKGPYSFDVSTGPVVILSTAKAEELDGYGDDDDLKMVLDDTDFGYNTARSWDGDRDQGAAKCIVIDTTLAPGTHTLAYYSEATPILYDATVLNAPNGDIALNQVVNESAPAGSVNFLWKTYQFSCDSGQVAVYISGSADEEPGWNHYNNPDPDSVIADIDSTDDDELRIELDDIDYGWESDSSFLGNSMFGDSKTILITQNLGKGTHQLKLYANESPTVYRVLVYVENKEGASAIDELKPSVNTFQLKQNYPNPFNPATTITYQLPVNSFVRLSVYNLLGQVVKELVNKHQASGSHRIVFDAGDLPAGEYFYRLQASSSAGNFTQVKKMLLIK